MSELTFVVPDDETAKLLAQALRQAGTLRAQVRLEAQPPEGVSGARGRSYNEIIV